MKKIVKNKWFWLALFIIGLIVSLSFVYQKKDKAEAFAPPPASTRAMMITPELITKTLYNPNGTGNIRQASATSNTNPFEVIVGTNLKIEIEYRANKDNIKIQKLIEENMGPDYFNLRGITGLTVEKISTDGNPLDVSTSKSVSGNGFTITLRPEASGDLSEMVTLNEGERLKITFKIPAEKISEGPIRIEGIEGPEASYLRIYDDIWKRLYMDPAWINIREVEGVAGDIYSEKNIKNKISPEKAKLDVAVAGGQNNLNDPNDQLIWQVGQYNTNKDWRYYRKRIEKVADFWKSKIEMPAPGANGITSVDLSGDGKEVLGFDCPSSTGNNCYLGGRFSGDTVNIQGQKVVFIDGNLVIHNHLKYIEPDDKIAFVASGDIKIISHGVSRTTRVSGFFVTYSDDGKFRMISDQPSGFWGDRLNSVVVNGGVLAKEIVIDPRLTSHTIKYDSRGVVGLPGIGELLRPPVRETHP